VLSLNLATDESGVFARGLRNTVFMATDPVRGEVWGTDNSRDLLGDDIPPDEINILQKGRDYGWPLCYGQNVHDSDFDKKGSAAICEGKAEAHIEIQAHSAPLGLAFIPEEGWPEEMGNDLLVAYHGSWNRSAPTGYKIVRFDLDQRSRAPYGGPIGFAAGFLPPTSTDEGDAIGRPVDILAEPGGIAYVSDDRAGAVYRIARVAEE
jgi:glucose/arabinose dehydrogenase